MISTATAFTTAWARRGSGPTSAPTPAGHHRDGHHSRDEDGGDAVRQLLGGGAAPLGLPTSGRCPRAACRPRPARPRRKRSRSGSGSPGHQVTRAFSTGMGSPVTSDSSTLVRPSITVPSTGIFSPGRTRSMSPTRTSASGTSRSTAPSTRRATAGCNFSSARSAPPVARARPELEHLADQHQRDDDRRRLEVDVHPSVAAEGVREPSREQGGHHAEPVSDTDAEPDQREHVRAAIPEGGERPGEEGAPPRGRRASRAPARASRSTAADATRTSPPSRRRGAPP